MKKRTATITLTIPQVRDVFAILSDWRTQGCYFGPKEQFDKRLDAVITILMDVLNKAGK